MINESKATTQPLQQTSLTRWLPASDELQREAMTLRQEEIQTEKARLRAEQLKRRQTAKLRRERVKARVANQPKPIHMGLALGLGTIALTLLGFGMAKLMRNKAKRKPIEDLRPLPVGISAELGSLTGGWYELARFPHLYEKRAIGSRLDIKRTEARELTITYRCELDGFQGQPREQAYRVSIDDDSHVRLRVFGPIVYDFVLIEQDDDYLVVGSTDRQYLWILGRSPRLEAGRFDNIVTRMANRGFDMRHLVLVPQQQGLPALPDAEGIDELLSSHSLW